MMHLWVYGWGALAGFIVGWRFGRARLLFKMHRQFAELKATASQQSDWTASGTGGGGDVLGCGVAIHLPDDGSERGAQQRQRLKRAMQAVERFSGQSNTVRLDESLREDFCDALEQMTAVLNRARAVSRKTGGK